ncbi:hypothetical protein AB0E73_31310, partial [Streptomyces sp. NPDC031705]
MSESFPQHEQHPQPEPAGQTAASAGPEQPAKSPRKGLGGVVPRGTGARWAVAVGAAAVIVGGGAAAVAGAGHGHHHDRADRARHLVRPEPGRQAVKGGPQGERRHALQGGPKAVREGVPARGGSGKHAPAPLPALPIGQAAEKAAA